MQVLEYGISFRNATSGPPNATIPMNESFPFPPYINTGNLEEKTVSTYGYYPVKWMPNFGHYTLGEQQWYEPYNVTEYDVSYTLLNTSNCLIEGEVIYLQNYSNATSNETDGKIPIISVSNSELNTTLATLLDKNASGFILIRDDISSILNCSLTLPGVATSEENGSLLMNLTENGSVFVFLPEGDSDSGASLLDTYYENDTNLPTFEKRIVLVNSTWAEWNWGDFLRRHYIEQNFSCAGFILVDSTSPKSHYMNPVSSPKFLLGSYSRFRFPAMSINGSILIDGQMRNFEQWVEENSETDHPVMSEFWIKQRKNDEVESYNVYCDIPGKNPNEYILISSHYESWWGQLATDDAAGVAIAMGILKYLNDTQIQPKCNLRFIFHAGHEGSVATGARSHAWNQSNRDVLQSTKLIINLDHLANNFTHSEFRINSSDPNLIKFLWPITEDSQYNETYAYKDYFIGIGGEHVSGFLDCKAYHQSLNSLKGEPILPFKSIDYIQFSKKNNKKYHETGSNHSEGDTIKNIDRENLNATSEIIWNITKYFCVNPDCWFNEPVTYTAEDSLYDTDTNNDSINVTVSVKSVLPHDKVRVNATVKSWPSNDTVFWKNFDFIVTSAGTQKVLTVTLPPNSTGAISGNYTLKLELLNSTGRINDIALNTRIYNDTDTQTGHAYLYPRGDSLPNKPNDITGPSTVQIYHPANFTTSTTDTNQDQMQYQWDWNVFLGDLIDTTEVGPYDSGENCTAEHTYNGWGPRVIQVRARDDYGYLFDGPQGWNRYGDWSNWSKPFVVYVSLFTDFSMSCTSLSSSVSAQSATELPSIQQIDSIYDALVSGGNEPYTYQWIFNHERYADQNKTVEYQFQETGDYTVTLNVTDDGYSEEFSVNVSVVNLSASFNLSVPSSYANPGDEICFTDTSAVAGGYQMINWTWDFDDGTCSYDRNATHVFTVSGTYNVSLMVTDNQSHADVASRLILVSMDETQPLIQQVLDEITIDDRWLAVSLVGFFSDTESGIKNASVNITYPNGAHGNYTMMHVFNTIYCYVFNDTDISGQYNYTVWVTDYENNTSNATGYYFIIPMPPFLLYTISTPADDTSTNHQWANINVTVLDPLNTSAFIDWDCSLKGYWPMESYNSTGVYDNSTFDNFGKFEGGMNTTNIKTGKYGKGLEFDGTDDAVDLGANTSLSLGTGNFTFMIWENSDQTSYHNKAVILTNRPADAFTKGYCFGVENKPYLYVTQSSGNNITLKGNADVTDQSWHHIAYVRKGTNYSIYVDGAYDAGVTGGMKNITNTQHTYLAYGRMTNYVYFDGLLDEPQLYNRALSREEINASYNNGVYRLYHNFTGLPDGTYSYYAHAIDSTGNQSTTETRHITIDTTPPTIMNVNASPHTVGFGYNITITADVIDNGSGVDLVTVQITYPGGIGNSSNHSMTFVTNDTYQYVFNDTWLTGQYNYTIWATDYSNNTASSSDHHFHVSADATIGIATLKDSYSGSQYINITDPPNPPENYTLVGRGLTWNAYYNASSGNNILEAYQGPVNYQDDSGSWTPINNSLQELTGDHPAYNYGYRTGNDRGLFGAYFKPNAQNDWPVAFTYNRSDDPTTHVVRSKLVGVGYVDPSSDWAYQYLQTVQSSQGQTNGNSITYSDVFTGTDVTWSYGNTELKEEITLSNATKTVLQNHPPSMYGLNNESSYLVFITKLDHQNLNIYNASGMLTGNVTISDTGIDFKDALGQFKCALPLGETYEQNNESVRQKLTYRIVHLNGNTYLLSGLRISDLNAMTFPVVIDPTLSVDSLSNDGYIYSSKTNYNMVWTASSGTVDSSATYLSIGQKKEGFPISTYYIYRSFVLFNTSALPSNAYLDSAILSLYKKDDYSTTDFAITIQNGQPTYPHNPLQAGDYAKSHYSGNGGGLNTTNFVNGRNNITLTDLTWINETGTTKLCLRSSRDINGTMPTGNEYVNVYSANAMDPMPDVSYKPKLIIYYRNQSKIKNTGSTDIKGYLLIQVQFYNTSQSKWLVDNDTVNETTSRTINSGSQLALDTIFNGHVKASNLIHGAGTYRVYTAFRDPEGNILKTNSGVELKTWWQFSKT